jgi:hypothetical protein
VKVYPFANIEVRIMALFKGFFVIEHAETEPQETFSLKNTAA